MALGVGFALLPLGMALAAWLIPGVDVPVFAFATGVAIFTCPVVGGFLLGFGVGRVPDGQLAIGCAATAAFLLFYLGLFWLRLALAS